jgi:hypothetical protein
LSQLVLTKLPLQINLRLSQEPNRYQASLQAAMSTINEVNEAYFKPFTSPRIQIDLEMAAYTCNMIVHRFTVETVLCRLSGETIGVDILMGRAVISSDMN